MLLRYLIMAKSIMDFIREDPGLSEKITYEEFIERSSKSGFDDNGIEEAYEAYKKVLKELGEEN